MEQDIYLEKQEYKNRKKKYLEKAILTEDDFKRAKTDILEKYKEKENSEQILKEDSDRIYTLRYYYNKKENKIELSTVLEYSLIKSKWSHFFLIYFLIMVIWQLSVLEWKNIFFNLISIIMLLIAVTYFKKVERIYKPVTNDILDKIKISLDPTDLNGKNIMFNLFCSIYTFIINGYILFVNTDKFTCLTTILLFIGLIFIFLNFLKWIDLNFVVLVLLICIFLLSVLLDSTLWEGVTIILTILFFVFTDDIWKLKYSNNFDSSFENLSTEKQKVINNRKIKYKVIILVINLILYYAIILFEKLSINQLIASKFTDPYTTGVFFLQKGIFVIYLELIFMLTTFVIQQKKFKLILNKIVISIIDKIYDRFPIIKDKYMIDKNELDSFKPENLVENIKDLSDEYSFEMNGPIKEGTNILVIKNATEITIVEVKIYFKC